MSKRTPIGDLRPDQRMAKFRSAIWTITTSAWRTDSKKVHPRNDFLGQKYAQIASASETALDLQKSPQPLLDQIPINVRDRMLYVSPESMG